MGDEPAGGNDEFLEVMRETRARFAAALPDRLHRMRELASGTNPSGLDAIKPEVHQIAGLSGTLGFAATGDEAAALEARIGANGFDQTEAFARIDRLLEIFVSERDRPPPWEG